MKIYTKTGDEGTTGLQGDVRVQKSSPRIKAYGSVDEANAVLGIALTFSLDEDVKEIIIQIQNDLFVVGSDLSNPNMENNHTRVTTEMITWLEKQIDQFEKELSPLTNFILPGGDAGAAQLHFARTIIRRSETQVVEIMQSEKINKECLKYINRLSDLLFVLARLVNKRNGKKDTLWKS